MLLLTAVLTSNRTHTPRPPQTSRAFFETFESSKGEGRKQLRQKFNADADESCVLSIKYPSAQRRASTTAMELEAHLKKVRSVEEAFLSGESELPDGVEKEFLLANSASFLRDVLEHHSEAPAPAEDTTDEGEREETAGSAALDGGVTSGGKPAFLENSPVPSELNLTPNPAVCGQAAGQRRRQHARARKNRHPTGRVVT